MTRYNVVWLDLCHAARSCCLVDNEVSQNAKLDVIPDPIPPCEQYKAIISRCSSLFSVSLHLSHFALSAGVPVTCFHYVGKFNGVLGEFSIADSRIELGNMPKTASEFATLLCGNFGHRTERASCVRVNLTRVAALARKNFTEAGDCN